VKTGKSRIDLAGLIERLHDPLQLRVFVTGLMVAIAYLAIHLPLSARISETTSKLNKQRKRQAMADEIEHFREQVELFQPRLPEKTDTNEWVQYVLDGIRAHPMKVVGLDSEDTRNVGPYQAVVLRIELDSFLCWLEENERFFRVDSVRIAPARHSAAKLDMRMTVLGMRR
jgi:type II secretory pathway component PulM